MIKIYFFLISALFINVSLSAQSNTFPASGNVGIGTTNPLSLLTLNDATRAEILLQTNGSNIAAFSVNSNSSIWNGAYGIGLNLIATSADVNLLTGTPAVSTFIVKNSGNVGIGTINPDAKLAVNGTIHAKEIKVDLNVPGADYVFEKNYPLKPLLTVNKYIAINHHLPDMLSAKSMETNGIDVSTMNMKLLQKVEELTLYLIEQNKQLQKQQKQIYDLNKKIRPVKYH